MSKNVTISISDDLHIKLLEVLNFTKYTSVGGLLKNLVVPRVDEQVGVYIKENLDNKWKELDTAAKQTLIKNSSNV